MANKLEEARRRIVASGFACNDMPTMFYVFCANKRVGFVMEDFYTSAFEVSVRMYLCDNLGNFDYSRYFINVDKFIDKLKIIQEASNA